MSGILYIDMLWYNNRGMVVVQNKKARLRARDNYVGVLHSSGKYFMLIWISGGEFYGNERCNQQSCN